MKMWTRKEENLLLSIIDYGASLNDASMYLNRSYGSVAHKYSELRLTMKVRRKPRELQEAVKEHHSKGLNDQEIAKKLGIRGETVWKARQRLGLGTNAKRGRPSNK